MVKLTCVSSLQETNKKEVIGVLGGEEIKEKPGVFKVLVEGDKTYEMREVLWKKIADQLAKLRQVPLYLEVQVSGNRVMEIGELHEKSMFA